MKEEQKSDDEKLSHSERPELEEAKDEQRDSQGK